MTSACHCAPELHDLLVVAADEVPPHHELFAERHAAQEHHPYWGVARAEREPLPSGLDIGELRPGDGGRGIRALGVDREHHVAGVDEHPVLEGRIELEVDRPVGREVELCAEER